MSLYNCLIESGIKGLPVTVATVTSCSENPHLVGSKAVYSASGMIAGDFSQNLALDIDQIIRQNIATGRSEMVELESNSCGRLKVFLHNLSPGPRLIILGGGHVGGALCRAAALLDYRIVVIDDRPDFASARIHPQAHQVICDRFENALDKLEPSAADFLVIVTRGHKHDRICLEKSLDRQAAYIGMIGSRKRVEAQIRELQDKGYSSDQLARIHSPIGLPIGAVTEPEIAISILAEITAVRRQAGKTETAQVEVISELERLEKTGDQHVLVTIINTMGSTPRKVGSQMIVYPDGRLKGTIGGGCSEADARREALLQLDSGKPLLYRLRLTAEAAAEEGMACGGVMDLFIEPLPRHR